jgi:hypothetical protein
MTTRKILLMFVAMVIALSFAGVSFAGHKEEKGEVKGTITKIEVAEYVVTVKDDKGKETKVNVKDAAGLKVGESVVVRDGKVVPAVKPKTGGY